MEDAVMLRLIQLELENWENPRTLLICLATLSVFLISTGQYSGYRSVWSSLYTIEAYITNLRDLMLYPKFLLLNWGGYYCADRTYQLWPLLFCRELTDWLRVVLKYLLLLLRLLSSMEGVLSFLFHIIRPWSSNGVYGGWSKLFHCSPLDIHF